MHASRHAIRPHSVVCHMGMLDFVRLKTFSATGTEQHCDASIAILCVKSSSHSAEVHLARPDLLHIYLASSQVPINWTSVDTSYLLLQAGLKTSMYYLRTRAAAGTIEFPVNRQTPNKVILARARLACSPIVLHFAAGWAEDGHVLPENKGSC